VTPTIPRFSEVGLHSAASASLGAHWNTGLKCEDDPGQPLVSLKITDPAVDGEISLHQRLSSKGIKRFRVHNSHR